MSTGPHSRAVKKLYDSALALEGAERERYLDENCADPAIRREVEELLAMRTVTLAGAAPPPAVAREALAPGAVLGHYVIQQPLGAGGMGLVYQATDQDLHRTVAIKILPPGNVDEDTRRRFIKEAQAASALNHPNIVTVYQVGHDDGKDFIAMERVVGRTLHHVIGQKGLDPRTAMQYAAQIADALAAAHEAGIVHRDLKPGNVMVTDRALVKVLDFGLAKHTGKHSADAVTETSLTELGHVMGTISYMSPEQAMGKLLDTRSDIFSFGSLLYEMLTGAKAFHEDTKVGTIAAIVNQEPTPLKELAPAVPAGLQRLILKCLQKRPHERWQHMLDVKLLLEDLLKDLDSPAPATPAFSPPKRPSWFVLSMAALGGMLVAAAAYRVFAPAPPGSGAEPVYRMLTADNGLSDYPALSKDGKFVAFASDRSGADNLDIWLQQIGGREPIRLTTDPEDETDPAFSPDGTRIAFRSEKQGGGIYVVPALGGDPVMLAPAGRNPRFSPDGRWVAYWTGRGEGSIAAGASHVFIVESGGGRPRPIHPEMESALYPTWSPRGDKLLVLGWKDSADQSDWWALPIEGGAPKKTGVFSQLKSRGVVVAQIGLRVEPSPLEWLESGQVLFAAPYGDSANLWEIGLSGNGRVRGAARRLTRGPGRQAHASIAVTADSERIAFSDETVNYDVWTMPVDREGGLARGRMTRVTDSIASDWASSITQDGHQVLYVGRRAGSWTILLRDLESGRERMLFSSPSLLANARISADGRYVVFSNAACDLYSVPAAGGAVEKLCERCGTVMGVSHDGRYITYEPIENEDLLMFDTQERKPFKLALRPGPDTILSGSQLSPDGKWVAFHSIDHAKRTTQVWIVPVDRNRPAPQAEWIAITDGKTFAQDPCWSENGNFLYFVSERDGFRCLWGQRLDPATKKPSGDAFPLRHFHTARQTLRGASSTGYITGLVAGGGRVVFSMAELKGGIWLEENRR